VNEYAQILSELAQLEKELEILETVLKAIETALKSYREALGEESFLLCSLTTDGVIEQLHPGESASLADVIESTSNIIVAAGKRAVVLRTIIAGGKRALLNLDNTNS